MSAVLFFTCLVQLIDINKSKVSFSNVKEQKLDQWTPAISTYGLGNYFDAILNDGTQLKVCKTALINQPVVIFF